MKNLILKTIVGSQAHGLASPESDTDYRGVYVLDTEEILSLNFKYQGSNWFEGKEDNVTYEIGHFLELAIRCNPSVLEVFVAPEVPVVKGNIDELDSQSFVSHLNEPEPLSFVVQTGEIWKEKDTLIRSVVYGQYSYLGKELRNLFPYIWNPNDAFNAFVGYSKNQQKKMLDNHLDRWKKYAVAYIRTLYNLIDLLKKENFSLFVESEYRRKFLLKIKNGEVAIGEIIDVANKLIKEASELRDKCTHKPDIDKVNSFLFKVRKEFLK